MIRTFGIVATLLAVSGAGSTGAAASETAAVCGAEAVRFTSITSVQPSTRAVDGSRFILTGGVVVNLNCWKDRPALAEVRSRETLPPAVFYLAAEAAAFAVTGNYDAHLGEVAISCIGKLDQTGFPKEATADSAHMVCSKIGNQHILSISAQAEVRE